MNGIEQRARHVALRTAEKRIDDVELFLTALAAEIVKDREAVAAALAHERASRQREIDACETALENEQRIRETLRRSLWQRLRWLVRGV